MKTLVRVQELALEAELKGPRLDVTLPGRGRTGGHRHPVSQTLEDICGVFARLGFVVEQGPEIELDWHNFEALNVSADHPARDMQDTFYVDGGTQCTEPLVRRGPLHRVRLVLPRLLHRAQGSLRRA